MLLVDVVLLRGALLEPGAVAALQPRRCDGTAWGSPAAEHWWLLPRQAAIAFHREHIHVFLSLD